MKTILPKVGNVPYYGPNDLEDTTLQPYLVNICYDHKVNTLGHLLFEFYRPTSTLLDALESIDAEKLENLLLERNSIPDEEITLEWALAYDYPNSLN